MHPTILSASAGTPIVGLSYNQKFSGFFKLLDLEDKLIHIEDFVSRKRTERLSALLLEGIEGDVRSLQRVEEMKVAIRRFNERILEVQP